MRHDGLQGQPRLRASGIAAHVRSGAVAFSCQVEELSQVGAFLRTDQAVPAGSKLEMDLVKPGGRKVIHIRGWVSAGTSPAHPGLDVDFSSIADDDARRLVAWLDEMRAHDKMKPDAEVLPAAPRPPAPAPQPADARMDKARMMLQIKGLIMEMDELRDEMRLRDLEIDRLRRELATAEQLIGRPRKPH